MVREPAHSNTCGPSPWKGASVCNYTSRFLLCTVRRYCMQCPKCLHFPAFISQDPCKLLRWGADGVQESGGRSELGIYNTRWGERRGDAGEISNLLVWLTLAGTGDAQSRGDIKSSEFSGFMGRRVWRDITLHSVLRLLETCLCFPTTRMHTHTLLTIAYWSIVERRGLRIMLYFFQTPWHFVPLRSMYSPQYLFLEHLRSFWLP